MTKVQKMALSVAILSFLAGAGTQLTDIFAPIGAYGPILVKEITTVSSFVAGVLGVILSFLTGQTAQVKSVVDMAKDPSSPVQGIITTASPEGKALAASIPGPIVSAGSQQATELAKP